MSKMHEAGSTHTSVPLSASAMRAAAGVANSTKAKPLPTLVLPSRTTRTAVTPVRPPAGAPKPCTGLLAMGAPTRLNAWMTSSSCRAWCASEQAGR